MNPNEFEVDYEGEVLREIRRELRQYEKLYNIAEGYSEIQEELFGMLEGTEKYSPEEKQRILTKWAKFQDILQVLRESCIRAEALRNYHQKTTGNIPGKVDEEIDEMIAFGKISFETTIRFTGKSLKRLSDILDENPGLEG